MSAISETPFLGPISQLEQFGSGIDSLLGSFCKKTDSIFCRVFISKKDREGNIKFYDVKDKVTGQIKRESVFSYIENVRTGDLQIDETPFEIAVKCTQIVFSLPFFGVGRIIWDFFKTAIETTSLALNTLWKMGSEIYGGDLQTSFLEGKNGAIQIAEALGNGLFDIVKVPLFTLGGELAAIYGIFRPYEGREAFARIEYGWHHGESYTEENLYLARCFQMRGNINESRIVIIRREPL